MYSRLIKLAFFIIIIMGVFCFGSFAKAATIYVNSATGNDTTGDGTEGSPYKTFHKGYTEAVGGDTLDLTGTFTWSDADETGDTTPAGYTIAKNITIQGQSPDTTIIQAASGPELADRGVLTISSEYSVTINDVTVRYAYKRTNSDGGGINNQGTLTVNRCAIYENHVWHHPSWGGYGGGIRNAGTLTVNDSTVNNNFAQSQGGGIVNAYTASGTNVSYITNTTIAFNSTAATVATVGGAGLYIRSGTAYVTNSTISYNVAPDGTGDTTGIDVVSGSTLYIKNSIVAGNKVTVGGVDYNVNYSSGNFFDITNSGTLHDNGGNIFGKVNTAYSGVSFDDTTWYDLYGNGAGNNIFKIHGAATTGSLYLDATLADNYSMTGTQTLAITDELSVAVDNGISGLNGSVSIPSNDQRGFYRSPMVDIGAYEYNGTGSAEEPTIQASNVNFTSIGYDQFTINWTNGNGSNRIVFLKLGDSGTVEPVDGTTYSPSTTFGLGTQIGDTGWYSVYKGSETSVTVNGLTPATDYIAQVFEYNGGGGIENYLMSSAINNPNSQTTVALSRPELQASDFVFSDIEYTQMTIDWTNGDGEKRAVFVKQGNSGTATPIDDTTYTASTIFGSGTEIGDTGWYNIYNGTGTSTTLTGLDPGTEYIFQVFEYNGTAGIEKYLIDTANDNPRVQSSEDVLAPSTQASGVIFSLVNYNSMAVDWTNGNGEKRAVFMKETSSGTATPVDSTTYVASTVFGSGTQIGDTGWYNIYNGTGTSVSVTGLSQETNYRVQVFEYNYSGEIINYNVDSADNNPKTQTTTALSEPSTQAHTIIYSAIGSNQLTVGWTNGDGEKRIVFVKAGSSGTATPSDETTYTASTVFGSGTQIGSTGWYTVYNGTGTSVTVTGLSTATTYQVHVVEYNGSAGEEVYLTDSATNNPNNQRTNEAPTGEDFETGDFSANSWSFGGTATNYEWTISSSEKNSGSYSAQAGAFNEHSKTSYMEITLDIAEPGNITYYRKVSSESGYDFFRFFIDGVQKESISGSGSWGQSSYAVDAGTRTFKWQYSKDGSVNSNSDTVWVDDIVFPEIVVESYSLNYTAGANGTIEGSTTQTVESGGNGTAVTAVPDVGYSFVRWSDDSTDNPRTDTNVGGNISVSAIFEINTHNLIFQDHDEGELQSTEYDYNNDLSGHTPPADPTRTGYTFTGWDIAVPDTMPDEEVFITAQYLVNEYTIDFDSDGGSVVDSIIQDYGTEVTAPADPTKTGYTFDDWDSTIPSNMPAENITLTAQWTINEYTITFDSAGGSAVGAITEHYATEITAPANPTKEGYTFIGWDPEIPAIMPADEITLIAQWEVVPSSGGGGGIIFLPPGIGGGVRDATIVGGSIGATVVVGQITNTGVNVLTYITNRNIFSAPESGNKWEHSDHGFQITDLDLFNNIVTLLIQSDTITLTLKKGESKEVDLDKDGINDIRVTFTDVYINRAEITITSLQTVTQINNYENKLIKYLNSPKVYLVQQNRKRWIVNEDAFNYNKYNWGDIIIINESVIFENGEDIVKPENLFLDKVEYVFIRDLKLGMTGSDVKILQQYLNNNNFILVKDGPGSPGNETDFFGVLTRGALIKFQKANKIFPSVGYFGQLTRGIVNGE